MIHLLEERAARKKFLNSFNKISPVSQALLKKQEVYPSSPEDLSSPMLYKASIISIKSLSKKDSQIEEWRYRHPRPGILLNRKTEANVYTRRWIILCNMVKEKILFLVKGSFSILELWVVVIWHALTTVFTCCKGIVDFYFSFFPPG